MSKKKTRRPDTGETRTAEDEYQYDEHLRKQEHIKSDVITELRQQNKRLWHTQVRLLEALIEAQDALKIYRLKGLAEAKAAAADEGKCVPGCKKHRWDDVSGWVLTMTHDQDTGQWSGEWEKKF